MNKNRNQNRKLKNKTQKKNKLIKNNYTIKNNELCPVLPPVSDIVDLSRISRRDEETIQYIDNNNKIHTYNLNQSKELSRGSYGVVVLLKSNTTKQTFVSKLFFKDNDFYDEYDNILLLKENNINCKLTDAVPLKNMKNYNNILVMNAYDGDLKKLETTLQPSQYEPFILEILNMFNCLVQKGVGYLDIKPGNILYKCVGDSMFMMKIGDIGSLSILNKEYGVVSNLPYEYKNFPRDALTTESAMVFLIGIMFLRFLTNKNDTSFFHYTVFKNETIASYYHKVILALYDYNIDSYTFENGNNYMDMLLNMLSPEPKDRLTLQQLIEYVSNNPKRENINMNPDMYKDVSMTDSIPTDSVLNQE